MIETSGEFCFLYSTFPDADAALKVARLLIDKNLAACVNVYPPMTSVYVWEGKREEGAEVAAFIKTRRVLVKDAIDAARPIHPYTVPCFLVLPIEGGNSEPRRPRIRIHSELKGPEAVVIAERGRMISGSLRAKVLMRALSSNATRPTEDFTHFTRLLSARTILDQTLGLKFERDQGEEGG